MISQSTMKNLISRLKRKLNSKPELKLVLVFRKLFGGIFLVLGTIGVLVFGVVFLILFFYPRSSLLNWVMVDFKLIEVIGVIGYYLLLLSSLFILLIPTIFIVVLGLTLFKRKIFFKFKLFLRLLLILLLWFAIFTLLSFHVESKFEEKKAKMKENQSTKHFNIKDFNKINISRFVKYDEITIKQGDMFSIVAEGSEYDQTSRTVLPNNVAPGETVTVEVLINDITEKGIYVIQIDLVLEGRFWFSAKDVPMLDGKTYCAPYGD